MNPQSRAKIVDVLERRSLATPLAMRGDSSEIVLEGYASTYEEYDCYGGVENGGWVEQLDRRAFDTTLRSKPDVQLLINHEGLPLARTTSGTLHLSADGKGLKVRASLDPEDGDVKNIVPKMRRGDLNEMSFGFRVKDQKWNRDYSHRVITEVSLHKGDVSVVNYGMNPTTSAQLSEAVGMIAQLSQAQMAELRRLDESLVCRAMDHLASVRTESAVHFELRGDTLVVCCADGREVAVPLLASSATRGSGKVSPTARVRVPGMGVIQRAADTADKSPDDEDEDETTDDEAVVARSDDMDKDDPEGTDPDSTEEKAKDSEDEEEDFPPDESDKRRQTLEALNPPRGHMTVEDARRMLRGGEESLDLEKARRLFDA